MRYPIQSALLLITLAFLFSGYASRERAYILKESELTLTGASNVKPFSCDCEQDFEPVYYELSRHCDGHYIFKSTRLRVPVRTLDCGNRIMNKDLYEALKAETYPEIVIQPRELHLPLSLGPQSGWVDFTADATVSLAGHIQKITLPVRAKYVSESQFRIQSSKTLCMLDFGIAPPTAMGGLIRVEEEIDIHFNLLVETR
ncbi:MAG: YceI family protein [Phaeodactylibacter sp.]|uniref:hypothetical protein n=1 Tax=Phaeodactylibacter sp. TaxID=1940289 RepID=UPI0032EF609B